MENKEPKTIRLTTVVLLLIILVLAASLVLMYIYYNSDTKFETATATDTNTSMPLNVTNTDEKKKEELDINSPMVQKLYKYIPATNGLEGDEFSADITGIPNAYQTKKITCDDLDTKFLLRYACSKIDNLQDYRTETDGKLEIKAEILQNIAVEFYGKEIENTSFTLGDESLEYNKEKDVYNTVANRRSIF